jgi:hypothetical protein
LRATRSRSWRWRWPTKMTRTVWALLAQRWHLSGASACGPSTVRLQIRIMLGRELLKGQADRIRRYTERAII